MTEPTSPPEEPTGSLSEEVARLMEALGAAGGALGGAFAEAGRVPEPVREPAPGHDHPGPRHAVADGSASCALCPVCQSIAFFREVGPEVRTTLATTALGLVSTAKTLLEAWVEDAASRTADEAARTGAPEQDPAGDSTSPTEGEAWR